MKRKPRKVSSKRLAAIAARILAGGDYTTREVKALAASVLTQTEGAASKS